MTSGPVSTPKAVKSTKLHLHLSTTQQFIEAAKELQKANFGSLISVGSSNNGQTLYVFVKKPPVEVEEALSANPDLCDNTVYAARYMKSPPKAIGFTLRAKLIAMRLVSQNHFM